MKFRNTVMSILLLIFLVSVVISFSYNKREISAGGYGVSNPIMKNGNTTWDCVYFGNYWQNDTNGDGKADQNDNKQPIKWRVLSVNGDDAFLLADQNLDAQPYNKESVSVAWENCTLRTWLNQTFTKNAFSLSEKNAIKSTNVENKSNPYYNTDGGNNTVDSVYVLSIEEACNVTFGFEKEISESKTRESKNTDYAENCGAASDEEEYEKNGWWWLRSPGINPWFVAEINTYGWCCATGEGTSLDDNAVAVRPALHLKLSSSVWKYAGKVGSNGDASIPTVKPTSKPDFEPTPDESIGGVIESANDFELGANKSGSAKGAVVQFFPGDWNLKLTKYPVSVCKQNNPDGSFKLKVAVGIGNSDWLNNQTQWSNYKKDVEDADKYMAKACVLEKYRNKYNVKQTNVVNTTKFNKMPKMSVMGYLEQYYDKNYRLISSTGKVASDLKWEASATWQFATPIGPMYIELKGGTKLSGKIGPVFDYTTKKLSMLDGSFSVVPNISLEGGYGISKVATIGAKGFASIPMQIIPSFTGAIDAEAAIHVYCVFILDTEYKLAKCHIPLWGNLAKSVNMSGDIWEKGELTFLNTAFANKAKNWKGVCKFNKKEKRASKAESLKAKESCLQESVLTTSLPLMVEADGKKVMVFQKYDEDQKTVNSSTLVYSVYQNGVWSEPKSVCDEKTSDFYADLKVIDNEIFLTWQKVKKQLSIEDDAQTALEQIGKNSEVYFAKFNKQSDTFNTPVKVTNNTFADMMPRICEVGGKPAVVWVRNDSGDMTQENGQNTICALIISEDTLKEKTLVTECTGIENFVAYEKDEEICVVYVIKENGKEVLRTENGEVVELPKSEEETTEIAQGISSLQYMDGEVSFISQGSIFVYDVTQKIVKQYQTGNKTLSGTVSRVKNGEKDEFVWGAYDAETKLGTIYTTVKTEDGYSEPIILQQASEKNYCYISPVLDIDGNWSIVANCKDVINARHDLVYIEKECGIQTELVGASINENDTDENGNTAVNYFLTNTQDITVKALIVRVKLKDGTILEKDLSETVEPGETIVGNTYLDFSKVDELQDVTVQVYAKDQENLTQNSTVIPIGMPDIVHEASVKETTEYAIITIAVKNESRYDADYSVKTSQDGVDLAVSNVRKLKAGEDDIVSLTVSKSKLSYNIYQTANIKVESVIVQGNRDKDNNVSYVSLYQTGLMPPVPTIKPTATPNVTETPNQKMIETPSEQGIQQPEKSSGNTGNNAGKINTPKLKIKLQKKKTLKASWKKLTNISGYQIQYAPNKKFKKAKRKTVKSTSITIKKLKKKKTYFVRVRAYKLVDGKKVYGKWSAVKKVKIKK